MNTNDSHPGSFRSTFWRLRPCALFGIVFGLLPFALLLAAPLEARNAQLVRDIDLTRSPHLPPSCPLSPCPLPEPFYGSVLSRLTPFGDRLLFSADDGIRGQEPWITDGSHDGTYRIADIGSGATGSYPAFLGPAGDEALFWTESEEGVHGNLWRTDGGEGQASQIPLPCGQECVPRLAPSLTTRLSGGSLIFWALDSSTGHEMLFRSDGTVPGTWPVQDLCSGTAPCARRAHSMQSWLGGAALLEGQPYEAMTAWFVDPDGAQAVKILEDCQVGRLLSPHTEGLYFSGSCHGEPSGLYRLPTLDASPVRVHGLDGGAPIDSVPTDQGLFLRTLGGPSSPSETVWWVDAGIGPTTPIAVFNFIFDFARLGDDLVLAAQESVYSSVTLWRVSPNGEATQLSTNRITTELEVAEDQVYFGANEPAHGTELWTSDGTPEGTRLLADIYPGPGSSDPTDGGAGFSGFAVAGSRLYFAADHPDYDIELWTVSLSAEPPDAVCPPSAEALCIADRFRITVDWRDHGGQVGKGTARPLAADTGAFWFFEEANLELMVKVIDGCGSPWDAYWFFAGGLTDVEVTVTVDDLVAGTSRSYPNALGERFQPIQDTAAFPTCDATVE